MRAGRVVLVTAVLLSMVVGGAPGAQARKRTTR
jgi:hypothetical protein